MKKVLIAALSALVLATSLAFAAPVFTFSADPKMNLMMNGETIQLSAYPTLTLSYWHINKTKATFIYNGTDANGVYEFYDHALGAEGWKDAPGMDLENGVRKDGSYEGTYALEEYTLRLTIKVEMGKVTAKLNVK
jgi:opacity protein-like surface antigen